MSIFIPTVEKVMCNKSVQIIVVEKDRTIFNVVMTILWIVSIFIVMFSRGVFNKDTQIQPQVIGMEVEK